jgi:putative two-component system response regulator
MGDRSRPTILVVDDSAVNLDILLNLLGDDYNVSVAMDGPSALDLTVKLNPSLILLDIMIPGIDGFEVCRLLKADERTRAIPVIFLTVLTHEIDEAHGLELGAVDYITKPFSPALVKARIRNHLELERHRGHLESLVEEKTRNLQLTREAMIRSMATMAELRDSGTGEHIQRTRSYVLLLARYLADHSVPGRVMSGEEIDLFYQSAPLHDIGKVGIPDAILLKPGKLTPDEFEVIRKHPLHAAEILRRAEREMGDLSFLRIAREIAESHHEKWDGSGYPYGLKGEEIPLSGRIMAVADVYDALRSERPYKKPFPHEEAVRIISEGAGSHFDPVVVEAFLALQDRFRRISEKLEPQRSTGAASAT